MVRLFGLSTHTIAAPAASHAATFLSISRMVSVGDSTSTARSGAPGQNVVGRPDAGKRSRRMKAISGARTVSGLLVSLNPVSAPTTTPRFFDLTWLTRGAVRLA